MVSFTNQQVGMTITPVHINGKIWNQHGTKSEQLNIRELNLVLVMPKPDELAILSSSPAKVLCLHITSYLMRVSFFPASNPTSPFVGVSDIDQGSRYLC
jgi:hypothetical protein